jgi:hypothetical protein
MLFVPAGSPHQVENLEASVAISSNYVDRSNYQQALRELRKEQLQGLPVSAVVAGFERLRHAKSAAVVVGEDGGVGFAEFKSLRWPYPTTDATFQSQAKSAVAQARGGRDAKAAVGTMMLVIHGINREQWSFRLQEFLRSADVDSERTGGEGSVVDGEYVRRYIRDNFGAVILLNTELNKRSSLTTKWVNRYAPGSDGIPWISIIGLNEDDNAKTAGLRAAQAREHIHHKLLVSFCSAALENGDKGYDATKVLRFLKGDTLQEVHKSMGIPAPHKGEARWRG